MRDERYIRVFTDGSCNRKNGLGGFGVYMEFRTKDTLIGEKMINGGYSHTTVSRMELRAIIEALRAIKNKTDYIINIICDSQYTVRSINLGWLENWERDNFRDRKNADLWKEFLIEKKKFPLKKLIFIHTRGHEKGKQGFIHGNSKADKLANYRQFKTYTKDLECPIKKQEDELKKITKDSIVD